MFAVSKWDGSDLTDTLRGFLFLERLIFPDRFHHHVTYYSSALLTVFGPGQKKLLLLKEGKEVGVFSSDSVTLTAAETGRDCPPAVIYGIGILLVWLRPNELDLLSGASAAISDIYPGLLSSRTSCN